MWKRTFGIGGAAAWLLIGCANSDQATEVTEQAEQSIVRGTPVPVSTNPAIGRPYVVLLQFERFGGMSSGCSGTYIAPRVVLTAAHCIPQYVTRAFAYWGNNFEADLAVRDVLPAPGQPSVWAKLESWQVNPSFNADLLDGDMAVVYLDRSPPFDPLPIYRNRLDSSWINKTGTLVGWGANQALTSDIQITEGFGVKRSGQASILGSPTQADANVADPHPGVQIPAVREHYVKLNGKAPNVNACSGDSGGPIIINQWGQDYAAGVAHWTGDWCEDYSYYLRIDPYLPFLDQAYRRGGQEKLIPSLDCVDTRPNGKLVAYFGYKNDNGISLSVPYDAAKNYLPLDVSNERPTLFKPGDNRFRVGIEFTPGQTVYWKLSPPSPSPTTELRVTSAAPRCADTEGRRCARACEASVVAECAANFNTSWESCITSCMENYDSVAKQGCEAQWATYLGCTATTPPAAENWNCDPRVDSLRPAGCVTERDAVFACLYPPAQ